MAQPGVVREPSMEEILASIRQIIESNEPGAGRAISSSLPPVYGADDEKSDSNIHLTVDETYADVEFPEPMMLSDPRFVAANSAGSREAEAPARAMSLADVAARVRAASERSAPQPQHEAPVFRQPEPAGHFEQEARHPVEAVPASFSAPPPAAMPAPAVEQAQRVDVPQPALAEPAPQAAVAPAAEAEEDSLLNGAEETQTLISQSAGLQVARSFDELALAIDGAERRSLDEIAEDMLRPMLREWLDDNLPTLVERLVREEIERVARGPRR
ncbi:hypothetical protein AM571_CH01773 [Rhizobium etli 8C-3]|uniref:DUF2497 domain-containing protein n=1 Tax=Rhizobium etli 8C-3 TaxID=538025 RepID=A0A1L5P348_RHIET|nr:DUF2497 domain-containing protein [Rhizobium etli]APO74594.1 hypothetical protein AM571_CH01773 [Rhizobium etli 8C-3]